MKRYIYDSIISDLRKKMVFITGPRQVGKTYLAKEIMKEFKKSVYLNYDDIEHFDIIKKRTWELNSDLVIFDEIHKMKNWKNYLKGTYDTKKSDNTFLITGSARLDFFRQTGDSLAGRYFLYHLNPISIKEVRDQMQPFDALNLLNKLGGFPEPFLSGSEEYSSRWRKEYFSDVIREDILDFGRINEIKAIKLLIELLRRRVGASISISSLAMDIQVSPNTVKRYISILESLNVIFLVRPYHRNIARAIVKEPKIYFFDTGYVEGDEGIKLENTVAICLLKNVQFLQDTKGKETGLFYLRTKDGKEINFVIADNSEITDFIEVKLSEKEITPSLKYFRMKNGKAKFFQIVHNLRNNREEDNIKVINAGEFLAELEA